MNLPGTAGGAWKFAPAPGPADGRRTPSACAPRPRRPAALPDPTPPPSPERRGTTDGPSRTISRPSTAIGAVLALGDSILCGPEEGAFGVPPRSWAQWLAEALDLPFHKLAQPGATTPWIADALLPRARDDYALACVGVGTNDVRALDWDSRCVRGCAGADPRRPDRPRGPCLRRDHPARPRPPAGRREGRRAQRDRAVGGRRTERGGRRSGRPPRLAPALPRRRAPDRARPAGDRPARRRGARAGRLTGRSDIRPKAASARTRATRLTRQIAHLVRDWRRRAVERNV